MAQAYLHAACVKLAELPELTMLTAIVNEENIMQTLLHRQHIKT